MNQRLNEVHLSKEDGTETQNTDQQVPQIDSVDGDISSKREDVSKDRGDTIDTISESEDNTDARFLGEGATLSAEQLEKEEDESDVEVDFP